MTTVDSMRRYHLLGRTGLRVSPLALGTMTFGQDGWGSDKDTARAVFDRYLEAGGNFVDTANGYADGRSETLVGAFLAESGTRDRVVLATKFTHPGHHDGKGQPNTSGNGRKNILSSLEGSLRRLRTDHVDLYWMHAWDLVTPVEEVMSTLDTLVRSGKVRAVGLSNVPAWYAAKAQTLANGRGWEPVAALQMEYSLIQREIEREHVPAVLDLGMGVVPWSPLAHGFLAGKYGRNGTKTVGTGRLEGETYRMIEQTFGALTDRDWTVLETLIAVANETEQSVPRVALEWVTRRPGVVSTLIGARTVAQLEDNLGALDFVLDDEQRTRLDEVSAPDRRYPDMFFDHELVSGMLTPGYRVDREPSWFRPHAGSVA